MKHLLVATLLFASFEVAKAEISLDLRGDYRQTPSYEKIDNVDSTSATTKSTSKEENLFLLQRARVKLGASLTPAVRGTARINFNAGTANDKGGPTGLVEFAYLTHDVNPMLSLSAGKTGGPIGGHEGDYNWADLYFITHTGGIQDAGFGGVMAEVKPAEGQLIILAAGNNQDTTAADQKKLSSAIYYRGLAAGQTLSIAAQLMNTYKGTQGSESKVQYSNFGLKYLGFANLTLDLEYLGGVTDKSGSGSKVTDSTVYLYAKYLVNDSWGTIAKLESSSHKDDGTETKSFDRTKAGLALEYYPEKSDKNFRYHVASNFWTDKFKAKTSGLDSVQGQEVIVGMRLLVDVLK